MQSLTPPPSPPPWYPVIHGSPPPPHLPPPATSVSTRYSPSVIMSPAPPKASAGLRERVTHGSNPRRYTAPPPPRVRPSLSRDGPFLYICPPPPSNTRRPPPTSRRRQPCQWQHQYPMPPRIRCDSHGSSGNINNSCCVLCPGDQLGAPPLPPDIRSLRYSGAPQYAFIGRPLFLGNGPPRGYAT